MIMTNVRVAQDATVYRDSPFTLLFTVHCEDAKLPVAIVGGAGRALVNSIKAGDLVHIDGEIMKGDRVGINHTYIFAVERITLAGKAALGRNLNMYA
ncbi:hypothetical protein DRH14_05385 [Candidatus Shapirobacteria bacterium]|nr:MAG: hypothetical protein DRH14_05385 [Candidatus Shapirobacteria bacterium]